MDELPNKESLVRHIVFPNTLFASIAIDLNISDRSLHALHSRGRSFHRGISKVAWRKFAWAKEEEEEEH